MSELAKRIRAARAWADLTQKELGDALGINEQSVKRTEAGTRDPGAPEQWAIAEITGVPRWFITDGFAGAGQLEQDELRDRLERIEALLIEDEGSAIAGFEEAIDEAADSADATRDTGDASTERNRGARRRHV